MCPEGAPLADSTTETVKNVVEQTNNIIKNLWVFFREIPLDNSKMLECIESPFCEKKINKIKRLLTKFKQRWPAYPRAVERSLSQKAILNKHKNPQQLLWVSFCGERGIYFVRPRKETWTSIETQILSKNFVFFVF